MRPIGQVVADDQRAVGVDAGHQLVELQGEQPAVGAQLDHVAGDLVGDPAHHLQPLHHRDRVADGDQVLDLQRGQRAGDLVQPQLVALQRGQRLVGPGQDRRRVVEDVPLAVDVEADDAHRLADRDDRVAGLLGDPLGGAVPGAGLLGRDGRVGHQVHGGPDDPGAVAGQHDGAVHLAQLAQPGRGELDVEREAAGAERLDDLVVARARSARRCGRAGCAPGRRAARCRAPSARGWRAAGRRHRRRRPVTLTLIGRAGEPTTPARAWAARRQAWWHRGRSARAQSTDCRAVGAVVVTVMCHDAGSRVSGDRACPVCAGAVGVSGHSADARAAHCSAARTSATSITRMLSGAAPVLAGPQPGGTRA